MINRISLLGVAPSKTEYINASVMNSEDIRKNFLDFFKNKGHKIVPSSSLIPDDPSVLLTTAGMQQFKKYYTGELDALKDFGTKNTASIQKCFRTSDIDEVGDESHLTFFEMLGNFSFGGYFKKESIEYAYEFITKVMKLPVEHVTVFDPKEVPQGDWRKGVPFDEASCNIWKSILPEEKIQGSGTDSFWGPTGNEGPCGPTTEIYVNNSAGKPIEVWNIVFNEFYRDPNNNLKKLATPGVDTGMGLERLAMVSQNAPTIFETDLFKPIIKQLYPGLSERIKRIIADHARGIAFLISDGVRPSNKETGYILRRLMRRVITYAYRGNIGEPPENLLQTAVAEYGQLYSLDVKSVKAVYAEEYQRFIKTIAAGEKKLSKIIEGYTSETGYASLAQKAFDLYQSQGLPMEAVLDKFNEKVLKIDILEFRRVFEEEFKKHQQISRTGAEKKFGGHGLLMDTGELKAGSEEEIKEATRLHTATHLLHWALREVLGKDVKQMGSDINPERTRFDFSLSRKMTPEEIKKVEELVNQKIEEDLPVSFKEMPEEDAEKTGALHFFKQKYPDIVKVYFIGNISSEFCGGPHVERTSEIGKFKIMKEESVGAGVRRIRANVV